MVDLRGVGAFRHFVTSGRPPAPFQMLLNRSHLRSSLQLPSDHGGKNGGPEGSWTPGLYNANFAEAFVHFCFILLDDTTNNALREFFCENYCAIKTVIFRYFHAKVLTVLLTPSRDNHFAERIEDILSKAIAPTPVFTTPVPGICLDGKWIT